MRSKKWLPALVVMGTASLLQADVFNHSDDTSPPAPAPAPKPSPTPAATPTAATPGAPAAPLPAPPPPRFPALLPHPLGSPAATQGAATQAVSPPSAPPGTQPGTQPAAAPFAGAATQPSPPTFADFTIHSDNAITDEQVLKAINNGVDYLLAQRKGDNFESSGGYAGGGANNVGAETALIVYALLHVAESVNDPELRKKTNFASPDLAPVITYLKNCQPDGTYLAALLCCSLTLMPKTPDIVAALERPKGAKAYILHATNDTGGYEYTIPGSAIDAKLALLEKNIADLRAKLNAPGQKQPGDVKVLNDAIKAAVAELTTEQQGASKQRQNLSKYWNPDGSNTQYGVLGAWALADYGIPMPSSYWLLQDAYWRRLETPEGAFPYNKNELKIDPKNPLAPPKKPRITMTAAGLATMFVTQEFIDTEPRLIPRVDKQMDSAIAFITDSFTSSGSDLYYFYAVERVGLASGLKFLGEHDWYREFAENLVKTQTPAGSWSGNGFYHGTTSDGVTIATAYALLTLSRGRNPVLVNKLEYAGPWNARSRDAARLTEKLGKAFERPLNWQVVSEKIAPENWMDAPVLLITGSEDPKFSPETIQKLKTFTEMGGLIFSTSDGETQEFTDAIKAVAAQVLPGRQMRELGPDHPVLNGDLWTPVKDPPKLLGLSNGIREVWIHSPTDMGAAWMKKDYDAKVDWDIPGNIYLYATGKSNLKSRLQSPVVMEPTVAPTGPTLVLGRLMFGDNADPEPAAWPRMVRLMRNVCQTDVRLTSVTLSDLAKSDPPPPPVIHLTGTTTLGFSDAQVATLRAYLNNGGLLIADSAGMAPDFTSSFTKLCARIYPKSKMGYLPASSPIYKGPYPNAKPIEAVRYRPFYALKHDIPTDPHLQAVQPVPNGRYTIIFSDEDITSGLLGTNTWGINGYTPESAQALARNILLYALNSAPVPASTLPAPPATQPTTKPAAK